MVTKLCVLLSCCLFSYLNTTHNGAAAKKALKDQALDCNLCYFMGQSFSIGAVNGANNQTCALGSNHQGAVWVNHGANVTAATCKFCSLAGTWYSEGAVNGTISPPQYCRSGQWK
jgi:hypothetical protein